MKLGSLFYNFLKALYSLGLLLVLDWKFQQNLFDEYVVFISLVFLCGSITNLNLMYSSQIHFKVSYSLRQYAGIFAYRIFITGIVVMILKMLGYSNIILIFVAITSKAVSDILIGYFRNRLEFNYGSLLIFTQIVLTTIVVLYDYRTIAFKSLVLLLTTAELVPAILVCIWLVKNSRGDWSWKIRDLVLTGVITIPFTLILPLTSNLRTQHLYNFSSVENAVNYSLSFKMATPVMLACGIALNYSIQTFKKNDTYTEFIVRLRDISLIGFLAIFVILASVSSLNVFGFGWWLGLSFSRVPLEYLFLSSLFLIIVSLSTFLNQTLVYLNSSMASFVWRYVLVLLSIVLFTYLIKDNTLFGSLIIVVMISSFGIGFFQIKKLLK